MGWVWRDDDDANDVKSSSLGGAISEYQKNRNYSSSSSDEMCSTRTIVRSQCKTEEVEPGKFLRKCEKTEEVLRGCLGKPVEVLTSNKEYTEEDVTDQMAKGSLPLGNFDDGSPFNLPGLRSDIEDIERRFRGGLGRFFEAAEDMKNNIFDVFGDFYGAPSSPSIKQRRPSEDHARMEAPPEPKDHRSGDVDLFGLARDV